MLDWLFVYDPTGQLRNSMFFDFLLLTIIFMLVFIGGHYLLYRRWQPALLFAGLFLEVWMIFITLSLMVWAITQMSDIKQTYACASWAGMDKECQKQFGTQWGISCQANPFRATGSIGPIFNDSLGDFSWRNNPPIVSAENAKSH